MTKNKDEIIFTLDTRMPPTLTAQYRGRTKSVGIHVVPKVMNSKIPLLFEEQVVLAVDYLKTILHYRVQHETTN